jgi:hypothetical protein
MLGGFMTLFVLAALATYFYIFVKTWNAGNKIPSPSPVSLTEEQKKSAVRFRIASQLSSLFFGLCSGLHLVKVNLVIPSHYITEDYRTGTLFILINLICFRKSQRLDFELYNVPILLPPACNICGSTNHSHIYCNAPVIQPVLDWEPTLNSLASEPLGKRGDTKKRFYYLKSLSKIVKKSKNPESDFDSLSFNQQLIEMRKNGFVLTPEQSQDRAKAVQAFKQAMKIKSEKVISTPFGRVESDFPLQCNEPAKDKDRIAHVATYYHKFEKIDKNDDKEFDDFIVNSIGTPCDNTTCSGVVVLRNG